MNNLENHFYNLRLTGMKNGWKTLIETKQHHQLTLSEGLEILLQNEVDYRENKRFKRLQTNAKFRYQATAEQFIYSPERGLNKEQIIRLISGNYIQQGESVLITGATGCGKSYIASALGQQACLQGYKVAYYSFLKMLEDLKLSRINGTTVKLFNQIAKQDLLILDDFGLSHLEKQQQLDLMEIIEDRHSRKATMIISQLPVSNWHDIIGEATIADAILDRLVHTSHRIELMGKSLRKNK